jgi:hypothetical protein
MQSLFSSTVFLSSITQMCDKFLFQTLKILLKNIKQSQDRHGQTYKSG